MNKTNLTIEQLVGRKILMAFLQDRVEEITVEKLSPSKKYCKISYGIGYQWVSCDAVLLGLIEFLDE